MDCTGKNVKTGFLAAVLCLLLCPWAAGGPLTEEQIDVCRVDSLDPPRFATVLVDRSRLDKALMNNAVLGSCGVDCSARCDDGDMCTLDFCGETGATSQKRARLSVSSRCWHVRLPWCCETDDDCDDDNACTTEICNSNRCRRQQVDCDDGDVCTDDLCDPVDGCANTNNSASCDDGSACTTVDTCAGGLCVGEADVSCDDNNPCTDDACDPVDGSCVFTPDDTNSCDDGLFCTGAARCSGGGCVVASACPPVVTECGFQTCDEAIDQCVITPVDSDCDDGNACTDDSCDGGACVFTNNAASCNNGDACTTNDTCSGGLCVGGSSLDCEDDNVCTDDSCDPTSGCVNADNTASCDDGDACTTADTCANGTCGGGSALNCDDSNVCTDDSCDSAVGCINTDNSASCADSVACTDDTCDPTTGCQNTANDANCSTNQVCDAANGCEDKLGDNEACISNDQCLSGLCSLFVCAECDPFDGSRCHKPCTSDADCVGTCVDGTCADRCNAFGDCQPKGQNGDPCLTDEECLSGMCNAGLAGCRVCTAQCDGCGDCASDGDCPDGESCVEEQCAITQNCSVDTDCPLGSRCSASKCTSTQYCDYCGNCQDKLADGHVCTPFIGDDECISGDCNSCHLAATFCFGGCDLCESCFDDADCPNGHSCVDRHCAPTQSCTADSDCPTNTSCVDSMCTNAQYCGCSGCEDKLPNGSVCSGDNDCISDVCVGSVLNVTPGVCNECGSNVPCTNSDQFCDVLGFCQDKFGNNHVCLNDDECLSGHCAAGFCAQCVNDGGCPASQFCDAFGDCVDDLGNNAACINHDHCQSGLCSLGFCAECDWLLSLDSRCRKSCISDADCAGICESGICQDICNVVGDCVPESGNNEPCAVDTDCASGICAAGLCAECIFDSQCPVNQFCDFFGDCVDDLGNNAACIENAHCASGICSFGFCAECTQDSHCPSNQFCNGFGDCENKRGNNAACISNDHCASGICSIGFCAECDSHDDCNSNQFCNGGGDCENKFGGGHVCCCNHECLSGNCSFFFCTNP